MKKSYIGTIPNPHIRDFQRKKLYYAEALCTFWNEIEPISKYRVKKLVKDISSWANITPPTISYATTIKNGRVAFATKADLVLPFPLSRSIPFICHEMSHVINYQIGPADHHGPNFASAYLEVVHTFMGQTEYEELLNSFNQLKVKHKEVIHI